MLARVIEPPEPIVTWEEAKAHLRVGDGERVYVERLVAAAQAWFDGPAGWVGHSFGLQTVEFYSAGFEADPLPFQPIAEVVSVEYRDGAGVTQTVPPDAYRLLKSGALYAASWPSTGGGPEAVCIRVKAGYPAKVIPPDEEDGEATSVSTVPASAKEAVMLIIGHWFANREAVVVGTISAQVPLAAEALLAPFRSWRG